MAVVDYVEGKGPLPPELSLYWQVQTYHSLPEPGGLLDQPAGLLDRMTAAANVYSIMKSRTQSKDWVKWAENNQDSMKVFEYIDWLRSNRTQNG